MIFVSQVFCMPLTRTKTVFFIVRNYILALLSAYFALRKEKIPCDFLNAVAVKLLIVLLHKIL